MRTRLVIALLVGSLLGCGDSEAPTAPSGNAPEILASVVIDTCDSPVPASSGSLDSLCGRSSLVSISPEFVYSDVKDEYLNPSTKIRTLVTGPATWHFSDPRFRAALLQHFDGRSLRIRAQAVAGESTISVFAISGRADPYSMIMVSLRAPIDAALDSDGYPIVEAIEVRGGSFLVVRQGSDGTESAAGPADAAISVSELPIETDREPPVVARPDLTPEELRAAPTILKLGDKTLVFLIASVRQSWGTGGIGMRVRITEESLKNVDEVRMDFVWMVHESGVWEPQVRSIWNTYEYEQSIVSGPGLPVGTVVDVIVGFVDMSGVVRLMRASTQVMSDL
jgi:hypothetical protein